MEQIFIDKQVSQIVIPLDEYKELLVTKGKYESLKEQNSINYDKVTDEYISKDSIINYLNESIKSNNSLKKGYSEDSEAYKFVHYTNNYIKNIIDKIKGGEIK